MNEHPIRKTLADQLKECVALQATKAAMILIKEYSAYTIEEGNKAEGDGMKGFVSRRFDLAFKYALIHHASVLCEPKHLFAPITAKDFEYGILIAEMLAGWKIHVLAGKVVSGDFHRDCEVFKDAILSALKNGRKSPSFSVLAARRPQLKNWPPKHSEAVINVLKKRGEIITKEIKATTRYYLPKDVNND